VGIILNLILEKVGVKGDKMETNEMGGACSSDGEEERRVQGFGGET
jgi:hypothetical protein